MTQKQISRLTSDWMKITKEEIKVKEISEETYGFGSELACLRLYLSYRMTDRERTKCAYSENMGSWFFRLSSGKK